MTQYTCVACNYNCQHDFDDDYGEPDDEAWCTYCPCGDTYVEWEKDEERDEE